MKHKNYFFVKITFLVPKQSMLTENGRPAADVFPICQMWGIESVSAKNIFLPPRWLLKYDPVRVFFFQLSIHLFSDIDFQKNNLTASSVGNVLPCTISSLLPCEINFLKIYSFVAYDEG
jgi:hypothetical protein